MISLKQILQESTDPAWKITALGVDYHQKELGITKHNTNVDQSALFFKKYGSDILNPKPDASGRIPGVAVKDRYADMDTEIKRIASLAPYRGTEQEEDWLDNIQSIADWIGLVPYIGDAVDVLNSIVYFARGKWIDGTLSIIAMVPVVGSAIAIPFKLAFKALGSMGEVIGKLLLNGKGEAAAKKFIETLQKNNPDELKKVIDICKKYSSDIEKFMKPLNDKFEKLRSFDALLVPDFIVKRLNQLGANGADFVNTQRQFFETISESTPNITKYAGKQTIKKEQELLKKMLSDKEVRKYLSQLSPTEAANFKQVVRAKQYNFETIQRFVKQQLKPVYKTTQGIKFSQRELDLIDFQTTKIKAMGHVPLSAPVPTTIQISNPHGKQIVVQIQVIDVKTEFPELWNRGYTEAWAEPTSLGYDTNKIIFDKNYVKESTSDEINSVLVHELAHIKDPSFKSPKLLKRYRPRDKDFPAWTSINLSKDPADAGKSFWNTYYLHPFEVNAITPQVAAHIVSTTQDKVKTVGKQKTLDALNQIQNWTKNVDTNWTQDAADLLGYERSDIATFLDAMAEKNPAADKKLRTQLAKQTEYLKTQVNNNVYESIISLKQLLTK
jgi:hypothetical protein